MALQLSTVKFQQTVLKNIHSDNFLRIILKASVAEFVFSKIPCFPYILMNKFKRMLLNIAYRNTWLGN